MGMQADRHPDGGRKGWTTHISKYVGPGLCNGPSAQEAGRQHPSLVCTGQELTLGLSPAGDVAHCAVSHHVVRGGQTSWDDLVGDDGRAARKTSTSPWAALLGAPICGQWLLTANHRHHCQEAQYL